MHKGAGGRSITERDGLVSGGQLLQEGEPQSAVGSKEGPEVIGQQGGRMLGIERWHPQQSATC